MQLYSGQTFGATVASTAEGSTDIRVPGDGVIQSFHLEALNGTTLLDRRLFQVAIIVNGVVVIGEWTPAQAVCDPLTSLDDRFIGVPVSAKDTVQFKVKNLSPSTATIHVGVRYRRP